MFYWRVMSICSGCIHMTLCRDDWHLLSEYIVIYRRLRHEIWELINKDVYLWCTMYRAAWHLISACYTSQCLYSGVSVNRPGPFQTKSTDLVFVLEKNRLTPLPHLMSGGQTIEQPIYWPHAVNSQQVQLAVSCRLGKILDLLYN